MKQVIGAFILCVATLTGVLWLTQALQRIDLVASQGQALTLFLKFTLLSMPGMLIVVAPIAFFISCVYIFNRLNNDSEMVVISASGGSRWLVMRPILSGALIVTILMYAASMHFVPMAWRELRVLITEIRTDILSSIVQEGEFSSPESGLIFHVRQRLPDGTLLGLLVDDNRDPKQHFSYLAERAIVVSENQQSVMVMENGSVHQQRFEDPSKPFGEISIVTFDRYLLDLSQFSVDKSLPSFKPRERYLNELLFPKDDDPRWITAPERFRSEFNERLAGPLYPLTYAMIALAAVGFARSSRERRITGILVAISAVLAVRIGGFTAGNLSAKIPAAAVLVFGFPIGGFVLAFLAATGWFRSSKVITGLTTASDRVLGILFSIARSVQTFTMSRRKRASVR